ncbi:MAG: 4Fe-4S dicluster domain-containing protein [Bacteroidetes bacterium]|nr:MAG: 4Fe-4S dicluster domain-containing protein [Bacteroidota bacterium]
MSNRYWKGVEELSNDAEFVRLKNNEFFEPLPIDEVVSNKASESTLTPRRDFLKFLGFSVAAASLASCEAPVTKSIPYLIKPEEITPGIANWYASSYFDGYDYCSVLVKTREGRPIKIEGNSLSSVTKGGVNARVQASVLSLYDNHRLKGPSINGGQVSWEQIDKEVSEKLNAIVSLGGKIRILSSTVISPSTLKLISEFSAKYPNTKHVMYDAVSVAGIRQANQESFGQNVLPTYNFDKADVIVSIGADFLVNWISPLEHSKQYAQTRKLNNGKKNMSRHIQFESSLSVTGSNADQRLAVKPSHQAAVAANLYNAVASLAGAAPIQAPATELQKEIQAVAKELWQSKGKSLVVCGVNHSAVQNVINSINSLLGSYGNTIDLDNPCKLRQGSDADLATLREEMNKGEVSALLVYNCNPVYTLADGDKFMNQLQKMELSLSFSEREDETSRACKYSCPDHHSLESWADAEPRAGSFSLGQPTIAPLFSTRQMQDSLLKWTGSSQTYYDYLVSYWNSNILNKAGKSWNNVLQDGVLELAPNTAKQYSSNANLGAAASMLGSLTGSGFEIMVYEKTGMGSGVMANNPWLQELPDPISKITWDNYLAVSPKDAREKGWRQGNVVSVTAGSVKMDLPVVIQPGQAFGSASVALGYGRSAAGKVADKVGVNVYPLMNSRDGFIMNYISGVDIQKSPADDHEFAATQTHHTLMGRAIVKETTLQEWQKNPNSGNKQLTYKKKIGTHEELDVKPSELELWDRHEDRGDLSNHHWGMGIDLNSCIGCGSCVIACTAENNVPVVGKDEVRRSREMHWMRIDRYYSSDFDPKPGEEKDIKKMEDSSDMPKVVFQPMLCQHCNNAPCETVCPVIATSHSSEGLNQMTYNRCVGTRYCANNCPYKVRRFNWFQYSDNTQFDYNMNNDLGKMVLNPDVVVRSRGVMEKCSMCVQRIQEGKLEAKKAGRKIKDGEVNTACAQSCPTNAIVFGDFKNPDSEVKKLWKPEERSYHVLEELNVKPNVYYLTKVRNSGNGNQA